MDEERMVKEMVLATVSKCVVCGHHYGVEEIEVVGKQDECWFLSMVCDECRTQGLVAAMVGKSGPVEILAEVEDRDEPEGFVPEPIGIDDVLDMHEFLSSFDGDFGRLFSESAK